MIYVNACSHSDTGHCALNRLSLRSVSCQHLGPTRLLINCTVGRQGGAVSDWFRESGRLEETFFLDPLPSAPAKPPQIPLVIAGEADFPGFPNYSPHISIQNPWLVPL
jgi:hypothetical protein